MKRLLLLSMLFHGLLAASEPALVLVGRQFRDRSGDLEERAAGDNDMSYGVFVDVFDGPGAWRFGVNYLESVDRDTSIQSVWTPEVGLLAVDGMWEAGISVLMDYVETEADRDWGDIYYQASFGLNLPLSDRLAAGIHALYAFEGFSNWSDFSSSAVEVGASVRMRF
jgi:hypothetical protein